METIEQKLKCPTVAGRADEFEKTHLVISVEVATDLVLEHIRDLETEYQDGYDEGFEDGKEEGRAERQSEVDEEEKDFVPFEDPDYSHTLFAIDLLQNVTTLEQLADVKQWLALQECRSMPLLSTDFNKNLFNQP